MYLIGLSSCTVIHIDAHIGASQARGISSDRLLCSFHESRSSLITALLTGSPCTAPIPDLEPAMSLKSAVPVGGVWYLGPQSGCLRCSLLPRCLCFSDFQQAKKITFILTFPFHKVIEFLLTFLNLYIYVFSLTFNVSVFNNIILIT